MTRSSQDLARHAERGNSSQLGLATRFAAEEYGMTISETALHGARQQHPLRWK
jgi:hypothetical protein